MRRIFNIIFLIFTLFIISALYVAYDIFYNTHNFSVKELIVYKGSNFIKVYNSINLEYTIADKIYFKLTNYDKKIKNGKYTLKNKMTKYDIITKIISPKSEQVSLTIPEGFTTKQVLERIEYLGLAKKEQMIEEMKEYVFYYPHSVNFEGYFYPETYFFNRDSSPAEILDKIFGTFLSKFPPSEYPNKKDFYNNLILASIIEKETRQKEEKAIISGIFKNRLKIGMMLQSDATLKYDLERMVYKKDLLTSNSKYNTYKNKGLTPTPICNPSVESIYSSMNPQKNNYYYFFMYKDKTYFSKTHNEHLKQRKESGHLK